MGVDEAGHDRGVAEVEGRKTVAIAADATVAHRDRPGSQQSGTVANRLRMEEEVPHGRAIVRPMNRTAVLRRLALALCLLPVACGEPGPAPNPPAPIVAKPAAPPTAPASDAAPPADEANWKLSGAGDDAARVEIAGLVLPKPPTWTWQQPTMQFRTLQYAVPGAADSTGAAELVFSLFKAGDGGPIESNITRWSGQFRTAEGGASTPVRSERSVAGLKVTIVENRGGYVPMGAPAPRSGFAQLGAIIEAPGRNVFIRLVGPEATVDANRAAFEAMVDGMTLADAPNG
jgi:hypothetical protein